MSLHLTFLLQCSNIQNVYNDFEIRKSSGLTVKRFLAGLALLAITLWSCNAFFFLFLFCSQQATFFWASWLHPLQKISLLFLPNEPGSLLVHPAKLSLSSGLLQKRDELLAEAFLGKHCFSTVSMPEKPGKFIFLYFLIALQLSDSETRAHFFLRKHMFFERHDDDAIILIDP